MRKVALALLVLSCHSSQVGWPAPDGRVPATNAAVRTVNSGYKRSSSQVLVREIDSPTRANLDWAAYHANFMNADPPPEHEGTIGLGNQGTIPKTDTSHPFGGTIEAATLTATIRRTPLTADERSHPLAFGPLVEYLAAHKVAGGLEDVVSAVRGEAWGLPPAGGVAQQSAAEVFLHDVEGKTELWVKVEFAPWFKLLDDLPDEDGDGVPEVYGRVRADLVSADAVRTIRDDYAGKVLSPAEVKGWANQLSSYWYPSYNTDLVKPAGAWPEADTEANIKQELGGASWPAPAVVMRGKPQGKATYNVFLVKGASEKTASSGPALVLAPGKAAAKPQPLLETTKKELAGHGATWVAWGERLAPFQASVRAKLKTAPPKIKGLAGEDGFIFYRNELESVVGGDLAKQPAGKNPLPVIAEFARGLAARGVDFLFVPVPNKVEVFPERLEPRNASLVGGIVNPYGRKFLQDLAAGGVEAVDLLTPFLAERGKDKEAREPLYQPQDTHWTDRGLELAAHLVAERIKQYPWYAQLRQHQRRFAVKEASFTRLGDLHKNLPEPQKRKYKPQTLGCRQVVNSDGTPYEDDPDSPIVVMGDSFTGVYQLTDCQHAGVSAHIAREIGYPVDLVNNYGGGPNVRQTLLRRGVEALGKKRLVVWMMVSRDLFNYWEDWKPVDLGK
jgi:alginate O-acetyltransferase complex protein AlgJ